MHVKPQRPAWTLPPEAHAVRQDGIVSSNAFVLSHLRRPTRNQGESEKMRSRRLRSRDGSSLCPHSPMATRTTTNGDDDDV
jgi:hypothetical protein